MARYLAIGDAKGLAEDEFRGALDEFKKWRFDRQSWVIKAYLGSSDGKLVIECETPDRARFESWLNDRGWRMDGIYQIDLIHEAGTMWPV
jgi:hypothetical protein